MCNFMKRLFLILSLFILSSFLKSQETFEQEVDVLSIDTILLTKTKIKDILVYDISGTKICIKRKKYLKGVKAVYKRYEKWLKESKESDENYNFLKTRFEFLDSIYTIAKKHNKNDTLFLKNHLFDNAGFSPLTDFDKLIEKNQAVILDNNDIMQNRIIRKKVSYYRNAWDAWAGRRYFLSNNDEYFYEATDWVS